MLWQSSTNTPAALFGVHEAHQLVIGPAFGLLVQQYEAFPFQPRHLGPNVIDFEGDVVNALGLFGQEFCDGTVRRGARQQLNL